MSTGTAPLYRDPDWTPPGLSDPFGPMVSGFDVEQAVVHCIRRWMPNYLRAFERQRGLEEGWLPFYRYQTPTSADTDRLREDDMPALAIVARGLAASQGRTRTGAARRYDSNRTFVARFALDCHSVCVGPGRHQARQYAQWYTAALRTLLFQHRSLDPSALNVFGLDVTGERYGTRTPTEERTHGEGVVTIEIDVADVMQNIGPSPMYPPSDPDEPLPELPFVDSHEITVERSS